MEYKYCFRTTNASICVYLPCVCIRVTVAEVVHVDAVPLQAAGALLNSRQEASPVASSLSFPVQPPGQRTAICSNTPDSQRPLQQPDACPVPELKLK